MSDISDLAGVFPTPFRWNAEHGAASYSIWNEVAGEREPQEIELGSPAAKFVLDMATRERGYGKIKAGFYDMILTPVGSPPPVWPDDSEYKPAIGLWLWNPILGELRFESCATLVVRTISGLWDRCHTFAEAAQGLLPVIHFVDRRERLIAAVGKTFFEPVIVIVNWIDRDGVPCFARRAPTVLPPSALPTSLGANALPTRLRSSPSQPEATPTAAARRGRKSPRAPTPKALRDALDDEIPW
jgi:hypothetical protein